MNEGDPIVGNSELPVLGPLRAAVRAFVLSRVRDVPAADDITQETLLRLHTKLDSLRNADRLEAWVFRIARNAIADHFRAARPNVAFDERKHAADGGSRTEGAPLADEEEDALRRDLAAYVRSVVDGLPEIYREALQLTEFEGIPQTELARRTGLSVSAAKSRVQRARSMVRAEMERCCRWETDRYGAVVDVEPRNGECCD